MRCGIAEEVAGCATGASLSSLSSSPSSESESDDEDEDEDGDGDDLVACGIIKGSSTRVFFGISDSSDKESKESDDEDDDDNEAWRRLRFLLRLRGTVGLAAGI